MSQRIWSSDVVAIGDRIAALAADQAILLNQYLADSYGIQMLTGLATPVLPEPNVLVERGIAAPRSFAVVLESVVAGQKIPAIKALREQLGLGLKEAKELVEAAPRTLKAPCEPSEAKILQTKLEAAGARVALRPWLE